jgi:hypothetical protein
MTANLARAICEFCGHLRDTLFRCGAGGLLLGVERFFELREIERCQDLSAVFVPFLCHAVDADAGGSRVPVAERLLCLAQGVYSLSHYLDEGVARTVQIEVSNPDFLGITFQNPSSQSGCGRGGGTRRNQQFGGSTADRTQREESRPISLSSPRNRPPHLANPRRVLHNHARPSSA